MILSPECGIVPAGGLSSSTPVQALDALSPTRGDRTLVKSFTLLSSILFSNRCEEMKTHLYFTTDKASFTDLWTILIQSELICKGKGEDLYTFILTQCGCRPTKVVLTFTLQKCNNIITKSEKWNHRKSDTAVRTQRKFSTALADVLRLVFFNLSLSCVIFFHTTTLYDKFFC